MLGRWFVFIWDMVFSVEGLGSFPEGLVLRYAILWLQLPLCPTLLLVGEDVPSFGGGWIFWVLSGGFVFILA